MNEAASDNRGGLSLHTLSRICFGAALRLEVNRCFVTAVHIERHRGMLMRDPPLAIYFAIANGRAHPDIGFLAACPLPTDPVDAYWGVQKYLDNRFVGHEGTTRSKPRQSVWASSATTRAPRPECLILGVGAKASFESWCLRFPRLAPSSQYVY